MNRQQPQTTQNPYKEPQSFYETFNKDPSNLQNTANFKQATSAFDGSDKPQALIVIMAAEFERLHGIIQTLALRYKDLEGKFQARERELEIKQNKLKNSSDNEQRIASLNEELERGKEEVSKLIVEREDLKEKLAERDREILGLKAKISERNEVGNSNPSYQLATQGPSTSNYQQKNEEYMPKSTEVAYRSEPTPQFSEYYAKTYENSKNISGNEYLYSPENHFKGSEIHSPGNYENNEYPEFKGTSSVKYEYYDYKPSSSTFNVKEEELKRHGYQGNSNVEYHPSANTQKEGLSTGKYEEYDYYTKGPEKYERDIEYNNKYQSEYNKEPEFSVKYGDNYDYNNSASKYSKEFESAKKGFDEYRPVGGAYEEFREYRDEEDYDGKNRLGESFSKGIEDSKGYQYQYYSDSKY